MTPKELAIEKILDHVGDPNNPWPSRADLCCNVLGYAVPTYLYEMFTVAELDELDRKALDLRRSKYSSRLSKIDEALMRRAEEQGDPAASKLAYQRFEAWSEKSSLELSGPQQIEIVYESPKSTANPEDPETNQSPDSPTPPASPKTA